MTSDSEVPEHLTEKDHNITSGALVREYSPAIWGWCDDAHLLPGYTGKSPISDILSKLVYTNLPIQGGITES